MLGMRVIGGVVFGIVLAVLSTVLGLAVGNNIFGQAQFPFNLISELALAMLFVLGALSGMVAGAISDAALELKQQMKGSRSFIGNTVNDLEVRGGGGEKRGMV